ncbi:hypothetical protein CR513_43765, partial [Mucuna pruriens]
MQDNNVWDLVELHESVKPIGCKWIFKTKKDSKELHQMDVKTTFLNGDIDETIYMMQPKNFASNESKSLLHETKRFLTKNFEMKDLGEASFVLGIQILRDRSQSMLRLSQENYISKVLERFSMKDSKPGDTLIAKGDKFSLKQCPNNDL